MSWCVTQAGRIWKHTHAAFIPPHVISFFFFLNRREHTSSAPLVRHYIPGVLTTCRASQYSNGVWPITRGANVEVASRKIIAAPDLQMGLLLFLLAT